MTVVACGCMRTVSPFVKRIGEEIKVGVSYCCQRETKLGKAVLQLLVLTQFRRMNNNFSSKVGRLLLS